MFDRILLSIIAGLVVIIAACLLSYSRGRRRTRGRMAGLTQQPTPHPRPETQREYDARTNYGRY